jgi:pimeloyl-ACP methyl ester carboxylesterase
MIQKIPFLDSEISFSVKGNGPAVVLVHGFPESSDIWDDFSHELSTQFLVVTPDLPGHGASGMPTGFSGMETFADSVHEVVQHLGLKHFTIAGHSMGGYVTMTYAKKYDSENKLNGICLFHSTVFADSEEKKANRNRAIEAVKKDRVGFIGELIPNLFTKENVLKYANEIAKLKEMARICSAETIAASLAAMRDRSDSSDFTGSTLLPFQFIIGKKDNTVPFEINFPMTAFPKTSFTILLENVAHMGFIEARNETLFALRNFLNFCHGNYYSK